MELEEIVADWHKSYSNNVVKLLKDKVWQKYNKKTPWSESVSELQKPSYRRLSAKWLPTVADPYDHILGFLDRSRYFSIK
jgi:hypothetical protein